MKTIALPYWVGHQDCSNPGELELLMIKERENLIAVAESDDDDHDGYDTVVVVRLRRLYYVVETSGCSCPSPDETWSVVAGPATKAGIVNYIQNSGVSKTVVSDFQRARLLEQLTGKLS